MDRDQTLSVVRECLADEEPDVLAACVFGSVARGAAAAASDVDVGVLLASGRPRTLDAVPLGLAERLERALGRRVDLVVCNGAPPDLLHRVLRDGVLVVERDRAARIEFEVQARNSYFDLKPILDRCRRAALESA